MTVSNLPPSLDGGLETHGSGTRDRSTQGWFNSSIPLGVWLALASVTILGVFLYGNTLAQRSTRVTAQNVSHVERRYEPMVRLARDLEREIGAFDRAVLGSMKLDASS